MKIRTRKFPREFGCNACSSIYTIKSVVKKALKNKIPFHILEYSGMLTSIVTCPCSNGSWNFLIDQTKDIVMTYIDFPTNMKTKRLRISYLKDLEDKISELKTNEETLNELNNQITLIDSSTGDSFKLYCLKRIKMDVLFQSEKYIECLLLLDEVREILSHDPEIKQILEKTIQHSNTDLESNADLAFQLYFEEYSLVLHIRASQCHRHLGNFNEAKKHGEDAFHYIKKLIQKEYEACEFDSVDIEDSNKYPKLLVMVSHAYEALINELTATMKLNIIEKHFNDWYNILDEIEYSDDSIITPEINKQKSSFHTTKGNYYKRLQDIHQSLPHYKEALKYKKLYVEPDEQVMNYINLTQVHLLAYQLSFLDLGSIMSAEDHLTKAMDYLEELEAIISEFSSRIPQLLISKFNHNFASCLRFQATVTKDPYEKLSFLEKGLEYANIALSLSKENSFHLEICSNLQLIINILEVKFNAIKPPNITLLNKILIHLSEFRESIKKYFEKGIIPADVQGQYVKYLATIYMNLGNYDAIYFKDSDLYFREYMDLLQTLHNQAKSHYEADQILDFHFDALGNWTYVRAKLINYRMSVDPTLNINDFQNPWEIIEGRSNLLYRNLLPNREDNLSKQPLDSILSDIKEIHATLSANVALIALNASPNLLNGEAFVFYGIYNGKADQKLKFHASSINDLSEYYNLFTPSQANFGDWNIDELKEKFFKLGTIIFSQIRDDVDFDDITSFVIIPYGTIQQLPLESSFQTYFENSITHSFDTDKHAISRDISFLSYLDRLKFYSENLQKNKGGKVLICADPEDNLEHAFVQAMAIHSMFDKANISKANQVTLITGNDLSITNLLTSLRESQIFHISAHGSYDVKTGHQSLQLSDGQLSINEFQFEERIFIAPSILTLVACSSGNFTRVKSNENRGLIVPLSIIGAISIVSSLTIVESNTANIVIFYFYEYLLDGYYSAIALRMAQRKTLEEHRSGNPEILIETIYSFVHVGISQKLPNHLLRIQTD